MKTNGLRFGKAYKIWYDKYGNDAVPSRGQLHGVTMKGSETLKIRNEQLERFKIEYFKQPESDLIKLVETIKKGQTKAEMEFANEMKLSSSASKSTKKASGKGKSEVSSESDQ